MNPLLLYGLLGITLNVYPTRKPVQCYKGTTYASIYPLRSLLIGYKKLPVYQLVMQKKGFTVGYTFDQFTNLILPDLVGLLKSILLKPTSHGLNIFQYKPYLQNIQKRKTLTKQKPTKTLSKYKT